MEIKFERNAYYKALQSSSVWESEEKFEKEAKNRLTFAFGHVDFTQFSQNYSAEGWGRRKVVALPMMVWSGVVKTTCDLVSGVFYGIFRWDHGRYAQAYLYCIARDAQEAFGWFVSLFNDQYGLYHIEKSEFQQTAYACYRKHHKNVYIDWDWTSEKVQAYVEKEYRILAGYESDCLSDDHWRKLKLSGLSYYYLKHLFFSDKRHEAVSLEENRRRFGLVSSSEVNGALQKNTLVPNSQLSFHNLFSDDHWRHLTFSLLSVEKMEKLFFPWFEEVSLEENRRRFGLIVFWNVNEALLAGLMNGVWAKPFDDLFSDTQWRNLNLVHLSKNTVDALFFPFLRAVPLAEKKRRFGLIPSNQVNRALEKGVLEIDIKWGLLFSEEQKRGLQESNLTAEQKRMLLGQRRRPNFSSFNLFSLPEMPQTKLCRLLGLNSDASGRAIRLAYRNFALSHHPDKIHWQKEESDADFIRRKAALENEFKDISSAFKDYEDSLASSA